ncbi:MAG TPA: metallophosphoesterase family protein [Acidobacteriota bacterium]|nr:metallophosphoesterase family protein [Acidobacteriota bacterium]HQQ48021.1 metallophosphoesterase family protein [Acidobacteriota bacterium]
MNRYAVISDIHGNILALQAVLRDIERRGIVNIINLGDSVHGPLEPEATALLLMDLHAINIRGNQDRDIPEGTAKALSRQSIEWLESLPATGSVGEDIFLCHGTPRADDEYLLEKIENGKGVLKDEADIIPLLAGIKQKVILCGHSHIPRVICLKEGRLVVNPGSVGLPAYQDETPVPHMMETGSPHARCAILEKDGMEWKAELIAVPYDFETAARKARANGREDWERWLMEGRA